MTLHAACWLARRSALYHPHKRAGAVEGQVGACDRINQLSVRADAGGIGGVKGGWLKVEGLLEFFPVGTEQAQPQTEVQRQARSDAPVVLEVRLDDLVAEIIFGCKTHLLIAGNLSKKEVGKRIAGGHPASVVEGQDALDRTETALLVLLSQDTIEPKLQSVDADDFGYVVPQGVGRVGVIPGNVCLAIGKSSAVWRTTYESDVRQLAAQIRKETRHGHARRPRHDPRARIGEINMVGGVTSDEFVQQRRRDGGVEPGNKAGAWSNEIGFNGGETATSPKHSRRHRIPRIVDIPKCGAQLGVEVVIQTNQFFAPMRSLGRRSVEASDSATPTQCSYWVGNVRLWNHCHDRLSIHIDGNGCRIRHIWAVT